VNSGVAASPRWRRSLPWLRALTGLAGLAWLLRRFDLDRFLAILAQADIRYVMLVPVAIAAEQLVRGWKWRQILYPLRRIGTMHLFGAIMAGYLLGLLIPFGFAALTRSWLVARREGMSTSSVLATVALDRLTDGVIFALLVPISLLLVVFPDPNGGIRAGLVWGARGSLVLFALLLLGLLACKRGAAHSQGWLVQLIARFPTRLSAPVHRVAASFVTGICWPQEFRRGLGIVFASVAIKLIAATHFMWAGLAMGAELLPAQYLFVMVFLGFLVILGHFTYRRQLHHRRSFRARPFRRLGGTGARHGAGRARSEPAERRRVRHTGAVAARGSTIRRARRESSRCEHGLICLARESFE